MSTNQDFAAVLDRVQVASIEDQLKLLRMLVDALPIKHVTVPAGKNPTAVLIFSEDKIAAGEVRTVRQRSYFPFTAAGLFILPTTQQYLDVSTRTTRRTSGWIFRKTTESTTTATVNKREDMPAGAWEVIDVYAGCRRLSPIGHGICGEAFQLDLNPLEKTVVNAGVDFSLIVKNTSCGIADFRAILFGIEK